MTKYQRPALSARAEVAPSTCHPSSEPSSVASLSLLSCVALGFFWSQDQARISTLALPRLPNTWNADVGVSGTGKGQACRFWSHLDAALSGSACGSEDQQMEFFCFPTAVGGLVEGNNFISS